MLPATLSARDSRLRIRSTCASQAQDASSTSPRRKACSLRRRFSSTRAERAVRRSGPAPVRLRPSSCLVDQGRPGRSAGWRQEDRVARAVRQAGHRHADVAPRRWVRCGSSTPPGTDATAGPAPRRCGNRPGSCCSSALVLRHVVVRRDPAVTHPRPARRR